MLLSQARRRPRRRPTAGGRDAARPRARCGCATSRSPEHVYQVAAPAAARRTSRRCARSRRRRTTCRSRSRRSSGASASWRRSSGCSRTTRLLTLLGAGGIGKTRAVAAGSPPRCWTTIPTASGSSSSRRWPIRASCRRRSRRCSACRRRPGAPVAEALVDVRRATSACCSSSTTASTCSTRAPSSPSQLLRAGARAAGSSRRAASRCASTGETDLSGAGAGGARRARSRSTPTRSSSSKRCACSSSARRRRSPQFALTTQNAAAVADICRRLDGIPLAIELAAARVRALPVEKIAARLDDRFRLLAGGGRTALPRQQTLRALIDWSYDLLTEPERVLLRRLVGLRRRLDARGGRSGLRRRRRSTRPTCSTCWRTWSTSRSWRWMRNGARYRLLETVRQYARERLDESGEADVDALAASRRLSSRFARNGTRRRWSVPTQARVARAARSRAREHARGARVGRPHARRDGELGLRLAYALGPYWFIRGQPGLSLRLSAEALAATRRAGARRARVAARCSKPASNAASPGATTRRGPCSRKASRSRASSATGCMSPSVLQPLGMAAFGRGDRTARADAHAGGSRAGARDRRQARARRRAERPRATPSRRGRTSMPPSRSTTTSSRLAREVGDRESVAIGLLNLAMVSIGRGSGERARAHADRSRDDRRRDGSKPVGQSALDVSPDTARGAASGSAPRGSSAPRRRRSPRPDCSAIPPTRRSSCR